MAIVINELLCALGVTSKNKNSIFTDIVQTGGGEVNPNSNFFLQNYFLTKREEGGVPKHIFV